MNSKSIKRVKDLKVLIDNVMLPNYYYKTNFSCSDFLIDINYKIIIKANLVKKDNKMVYEFVIDTQFISDQEITYDEIVMIKNIIEILEENKKFVLSRLKKYTVEEYEKEEQERKKSRERALEELKKMVTMKYNNELGNDYFEY